MKSEILKLIEELKNDIKILETEVKEKNNKLTKLHLIVIQLQNALQGED